MTKNDKYSLAIIIVGIILFVSGLIIQNVWLVVPGLVTILTGAGAYRGNV